MNKLFIFTQNINGEFHQILLPHESDDILWSCLKEVNKSYRISKVLVDSKPTKMIYQEGFIGAV